jgi:hypothetical protein
VPNSRDIEEIFTKQPTKTQIQTTMRTNRIAPLALLTATLSGCFTEANYHPYAGAQGKNPTAAGSFIDTNYAVPTYYGYPPRPYRVLGEMDTETHGRYRDALAAAANRASQYGADAIVVLGHEHHGEGAVAVPVGNAIMAAPIRADEAKALFVKWI